LRVPRGRLVGVLGRNGAGKSTLLRVLAGVYMPSGGIVRVSGDVASLFELGGLGNRFITGREYADRVLRLQGARGAQLDSLLADIEEFSELGDFFDRRIYTYSSGMAARLYFSVATARTQDVYLIDEILSVGDEHFQAKCWRRMRDRLTGGASGVLVTHDWSAVIKLCAESHVLDRGLIAMSGSSDHVVAQYLRIPPPDTSIACFAGLPEHAGAGSGEDWRLPVDVQIHRAGNVEFAFSIEMLRLGLGWEILMLSSFEPVATQPGKYRITLDVGRLPLAPGRYSLNLFLRAHAGAASEAVTCDVRSWTVGNALTLDVSGIPGDTVARLPLTWKIASPDAAH
jgi:lipopolysaccharide transport system ATP-binding protein